MHAEAVVPRVLILGLAVAVLAGCQGRAPAAGDRVTPRGYDCPRSHPVKGNADSGIYHLPRDQYYPRTKPEACFSTSAAAEQAGYRRARR